jgi:C1A family cysteine protease
MNLEMTNNQVEEVCGAGFSPPDLRDYKIAQASIGSQFPIEFELTMPSVKYQGSVSSCVAHAVCLVAEYYANLQHNIDNPLSVGYVYGNRVNGLNTTKGMNTRKTIANFCTDGTPLASDFPLHCEVPDIIEAVEKAKDKLDEKAQQFRFTSYVSVSTVEEMKTALMDGNPIIAAVKWYDDIKVKNGIIYSEQTDTGGGHAIVIYGWDENGWKIQNSWSELWGNFGRAVWPYDLPIREGYAIIDTETSALQIDKPHKAKTKFGKWLIKVANLVYSTLYSIKYKIKN